MSFQQALSGLNAAGKNLDVIGNNVANANTIGFKAARAEFADVYASTVLGTNANNIGIGTKLNAVTQLFSQGAISLTSNPFDVAISGEGRLIEATLHETAMNMLANYSGYYLMTGTNPTRTGNANQVAQPADVYEAADGPFVMACITQSQFQSLCNDVLQRPDLLQDERFAKSAGRLANVVDLGRALSEIFATKPRDHWIAGLRAAGVPAGAVATVAEALSSDLVASRETVREVVHQSAGPYPALKTPARLHDTVPLPPVGAPELGEHTRAVMKTLGGMSDAEIDALLKSGAAREWS